MITVYLETTHNACYVSMFNEKGLQVKSEKHFSYEHVFELLDHSLEYEKIYVNNESMSYETLENDYYNFMESED